MADIEEKRISKYPNHLSEEIECSKICAEQPNCLNCPWISECYNEDSECNSDLIYGYSYYDEDGFYDEDYYYGFDD